MSAMPGLSLILNCYEQPEYLARVLQSVSGQTSLPEEVLLADDGSGEATREVFAQWADSQRLRAEHFWQPHEGFRRARILNQVVARTRCEYLIFLDADTLPHPDFLADHRRLQRPGGFIQGHRALVQEQAARWFGLRAWRQDRWRALWQGQLKGCQHAFRWPRPWVRRRTDLRGIRGCNLAIWREDLVRVNGFNEAFVGWGREDSELAVRLMNAGVRRYDVRGWAACAHLWHPAASRAGLTTNDALLEAAQESGAQVCEKGVNQY